MNEFETVWGHRPEDDWVWEPDADPGLRFTPAADDARTPPPEPVPAAELAAPATGLTQPMARRLVAAAIAVFLVAALAGTQIGLRARRTPRPTATLLPLAPSTTAPPSAVSPPAPLPTDPTPFAPNGNGGQTAPASAARGVVDITTRLAFGSGSTAGTGMLLSDTGRILTNNHVIAGTASISVQVGGVGRAYSAKVVGYDAVDDVAVLQLDDASGLPVVKTVTSATVGVGDPVTAVGNAFGQPGPPTVVTGTVRALDQSITVTEPATGEAQDLHGLIQIDAPLQPGDSGGPLLNDHDQVIGMNTAASAGGRFRRAAREGFAIPIDTALAIVKEIVAGHASDRIQIGPPAFLGVNLPSDTGNGAVLAGVQSGTPAARAGLAAGDTITNFDGRRVASAAGLRALLKQHHPGDRVALQWTTSSGDRRSATVELAAGPPG